MTRPRSTLVSLVILTALLAALLPPLPAAATAPPGKAAPRDYYHADQNWLAKLPFSRGRAPETAEEEGRLAALSAYDVGAMRQFPALDAGVGIYQFKTFTLRAVGSIGEIWVAQDLYFPIGDCRNPVEITQGQVDSLLAAFERQIYPTDTGYFGAPKKRDGSKATLPEEFRLPADYYAGSDREIILVDNIREESYYEGGGGYIAGFFSPAFSRALDRNIVTIDAYDWTHRLGATPPDEPNDDDPCADYPARPFLYEAVLAHEYQHLIHYDFDPRETIWLNEGMSDFAEFLNGYSFTDRDVLDSGADQHLQSFLGYLTGRTIRNGEIAEVILSGAENSLPLWGDQGADEILADYGIAYAFMLYVNEQFGGAPFMRHWQNSPLQGIASFEEALREFGYATTFGRVFHDFAVAMLVDRMLDDGATGPKDSARYSVRAMRAQVNVDTEEAYSATGAPPYGSDYVKIADPAQLSALTFDGADSITRSTLWRSRSSGPADWGGGAVLSSGQRNNANAWLARELTLGPGSQILSFDHYYDIEQCYDYAFVQISTDRGQTFTSQGNEETTSCQPPDEQDPRVTALLPGFTGTTEGWRRTSFDLSAYAGQTIVLAFRYVTDPNLGGNDRRSSNDGWWIDNVRLNDTVLSDGETAEGFGDITAIRPIDTPFTVQIVGSRPGSFTVVQLEVSRDKKEGRLSEEQVALLRGYDNLVAVVTFDAPPDINTNNAEPVADYARYSLVASQNGEPRRLPGGGGR